MQLESPAKDRTALHQGGRSDLEVASGARSSRSRAACQRSWACVLHFGQFRFRHVVGELSIACLTVTPQRPPHLDDQARPREAEAEVVAFVVCEAIGLNAQDSADCSQLFSGDEAALVESLDHVERAGADFLLAITSRK
jgi:hypothetical protein